MVVERPRSLSFGVGAVLAAAVWFSVAAAPAAERRWWNTGWTCRQEIEITTPDVFNRINTAFAEIDTQGKCLPGGQDIRVVDEQGRVLPHAVISEREGVVRLEFQVPDSSIRRYYIYYGNKGAPPATGRWQKKLGGLTLQTFGYSKYRTPRNLTEMRVMLSRAAVSQGKGSWEWINDRENPFGPSEHYISVYKGLIFCPESGLYGFATNSDDASFLLVDGKLVVEWPWAHEESVGWEHTGTVSLERGVHSIEYYHVEAQGGQLARAGWKLPSQKYFSVIPKDAFIRELRTAVVRLEERDKKLCAYFTFSEEGAFHFNNDERRYVTVRFRDCSSSVLGEVKLRHWGFGDGADAWGERPRYEYKQAGKYTVTLKVTDSLGFTDTCKRTFEATGRDAKRVGLFFDLDKDRNIVRADEDLCVSLRFLTSSERPLPVEMKTCMTAADGKVVRRERDALTLEEDTWASLKKSFGPREGKCRIDFTLCYRGVETLHRKVWIIPSDALTEALRVRQSSFVNGDGDPVVVRTVELTPPERWKAVSKKWRGDGGFKVVVVDDSLAAPTGEDSYCAMLRVMLRAARGKPVQVIRACRTENVSEFPPYVRFADFHEEVVARRPDVVVIVCSIEDVLNYVPIHMYERYLTAMLDQVAAMTEAQAILVSCPPLVIKGELSYRYALATKRTGIEKGVPIVDLYSMFWRMGNWRDLFRDDEYQSDPVFSLYPNAYGQRLVAKEIFHRIVKGCR